jgi:trypsin
MAAKMLAVAALAIPLVHALPQPGLSARDGKIIGGEPAVAGDFPFIVSITTSSYDGNWCGGTLVNANTIITAAHCSDNEASTYKVRAGSLVCRLIYTSLFDSPA